MESTEVLGVPAYLAEVPGPVQAGLVFGVGVVDEPLPVRGVTHLCEHLVLSDLGRRDHDCNGFVGWNSTHFVATGRDGQIVAFVRDVVGRLGELPVERLDKERSILRAESATRGTGIVEMLLHLRFGAQSYGRVAYPEYGLWQLDSEQTRRWARDHFRSGNGALWIASPDPRSLADRLEFELIEGTIASARGGFELAELPRRMIAGVAGPNVSVVAGRSISSQAAIRLLRERLEDQIRHDRALAYTVAASYEALDAITAHAHLGVDALPEGRVEATTVMYELVEEFAERGPAASAVDRYRTAVADAWTDPSAAAARAAEAARQRIIGDEERSEGFSAELEALSADSIREAFCAALATALFLIPDDVRPSKRFPLVPRASTSAVNGTSYMPAKEYDQSDVIVVGPDGLTWSRGESDRLTVTPGDCEALLCWDDGQRTLFAADGRDLHITPWSWRNGDQIVAALDRIMPLTVRVPMGPGSGPPTRGRFWTRRGRATRIALVSIPALVVAAVAFISGSQARRAETERLEQVAEEGDRLLANSLREGYAESAAGEIGDPSGEISTWPGGPFADVDCAAPTVLAAGATFKCTARGATSDPYHFVVRITADDSLAIEPLR